MSRTIFLARHALHAEVGHVLSGRSEIELSAEGQAQAERLADRLAGTPIASIHSSPRRRARETAAAVARRLDREVRIAAALDEVDFGAFRGRAFAELDGDPAWERWNGERHTARCPGGETMAEATARARAYLLALPDDAFPALCVSHCDVIRGIVADLLGAPFEAMFAFDCDPASLTTLASGGGGLRLVSLNERVG